MSDEPTVIGDIGEGPYLTINDDRGVIELIVFSPDGEGLGIGLAPAEVRQLIAALSPTTERPRDCSCPWGEYHNPGDPRCARNAPAAEPKGGQS